MEATSSGDVLWLFRRNSDAPCDDTDDFNYETISIYRSYAFSKENPFYFLKNRDLQMGGNLIDPINNFIAPKEASNWFKRWIAFDELGGSGYSSPKSMNRQYVKSK